MNDAEDRHEKPQDEWISLGIDAPIWERFYTVNPLVVVGTREGDGWDLAPKHMAFPLGWDNYYAFVCSPEHATYRNVVEHGVFTVTYPRPSQVAVASLTASVPDDEGERRELALLETVPATRVDGIFLKEGYLFLECELERTVDEFGRNSLVVGEVVAAHVHRDAIRTSEDVEGGPLRRVPLLAYLHPGRFTRVDASEPFPFPADFRR